MMRARVDRLGAVDLATLWAEVPTTSFHIGLGGLLDPRAAGGRARPAAAPGTPGGGRGPAGAGAGVRRRIRWTGFGQGRPAVVDDDDFDIGRHLTAVDLAGVDEPGFWGWCANRTLQPLDREHPLWRVSLATGLTGGQVGVLGGWCSVSDSSVSG